MAGTKAFLNFKNWSKLPVTVSV